LSPALAPVSIRAEAADIGFEFGDVAVGRAAELAVGELSEPALD
jgi:hypothetical protein